MNAQGQNFSCGCGGPTRCIDETRVEHACRNKYAPATSFFDGEERFAAYRRVQINPSLTGGEVKFKWFLEWEG
jgi:hypothetical protein